MEELLLALQRRQEADADENQKAFATIHEIVEKLGSMVLDLTKRSADVYRGEASSSMGQYDGN